MTQPNPILLTDEQVQRFVADGFLVLDSGLPAAFHAAVTDELAFAMKHETPLPGDNLLPRIPATAQLLDAPAVRGAVASLLGPEFAWAPHRFPHNSEPLGDAAGSDPFDPFENQPAMGKGSISGSGWHQDGHSRAGRSRWHTFRAANLFYFPHDTPLEMGPTRLLAGTHLYANLHGISADQVLMRHMPAGAFIIADFDVAHAGTPNRTDVSRYMLKFVALRQRNPTAPSWDHRDSRWRTPPGLLTPHDLPRAWTSLWNWLRAAPRNEGIKAPPADAVPGLIERMGSRRQQQRLAALYDLAAVGEGAVPALARTLLETAGHERHVSPPPNDPAFYGFAESHLDRRYSHRQFVPEDAAIVLGAIGEPALDALAGLLDHEDPWVRINAAYALGEADALGVHADRVGELLDEPTSAVVRAALDALCSLTGFGPATVARLHRLLVEDTPGWAAPAMGAQWRIQDQIRYVAAWALTARASGEDPPPGLEAALIEALGDDTGYVPATACQGLERLGTTTALQAAVRYLHAYRWDPVHHRFWRATVRARQAA